MQKGMHRVLRNQIYLRTEPKLSLPSARSIIAIAVGYPNKLKGAPKSVKGDRRGMFARASWGQDYHSIMRKRLDKLADFIKEKYLMSKSIDG